ncbi:MAG: hypothetical protein HY720_20105 [Planctomycetes bacterium]|nr:hypothetical protein [Planctomycetota bacterium]
MKALALLAIAATLAGCASVVRSGPAGRPLSDAEAVALYVRWREAERQRDEAKLESVLYFGAEADRDAFRSALEALRAEPCGRVVAEPEVHLVDRPAGGGAGDFLFLVPALNRLYPERARIVFVGGEPRIEYEPPVPTAQAAALHWRSLEGDALAAEVERTRIYLAALAKAILYARERKIPLAPIDPDPSAVLESLAGLGPEGARNRILARLAGEGEESAVLAPGAD